MSARIALVGAGYWGKNLARNFHHLGALVAVVDGNKELLATYAEQYPGIDCYDTIDPVLSCSDIDAVAIAAPAALHAELAERVLAAGKHVFVEKPLALTVDDGRRLVAKADAASRVLMVGHLLQYHPAIERLRKLIADDVLGKLRYISSNRLNLGKIRTEENALWSFAPHDISVILSLAGAVPETVQCTGESHVTDGVADTTLTAMRFATGLRAHIHVSWLYPYKEQKLTVVGEKALAVFDDTRPWAEKLAIFHQPITREGDLQPKANKPDPEFQALDEGEPLAAECQHFIERCAGGEQPRTDGAEGLRVLQVLDAAQRSLEQEGLTVRAQLPSDVTIHPTAVVDAGAVVGSGTRIWHFCHVSAGAKLGAGCSLGQNVFVADDVQLGDGCKVQNNVSIYTGVVCEDQVFLGPSMVFTNVINPRCEVVRRDAYQSTTIRHGASIGANATIVCGIDIGRYAFIGAGAVVTKAVPAYALMVGAPARQVGWMSAYGERLALPVAAPAGEVLEAVCSGSGDRYQLHGSQLALLPT